MILSNPFKKPLIISENFCISLFMRRAPFLFVKRKNYKGNSTHLSKPVLHAKNIFKKALSRKKHQTAAKNSYRKAYLVAAESSVGFYDMKKLMVLGAGVMQAPLIKKSVELGHYTIVVGSRGNYPGLKYADKAIFQDFNDAEAVLQIAQAEKIDGIWTCGIDMPVRTMSIVSELMGLPGISSEAGAIVNDKKAMKESFCNGGVRTARFEIAYTLEDGVRIFKRFNCPVMFKAPDSQGSSGIVKVKSEERIPYAYDAVKKASRSEHYVIEEFLDGEEFGAQALVINGEAKFVMPHGDYVFQGDTGVPIGHFVPCGFSHEIQKDCEFELKKCVKALGLDTCAINADFMLCNGKTYFLEIGARCGATMLAESTSIYYGIDYYEQMIRAAIGEPVTIPAEPQGLPNATMTLYSEKDGTIVLQENNNSGNPDILEVQFDYQIGDTVRNFKLGRDRIGHVIVKGNTLEKAQKTLEEALANTRISVE